MNTRRVTRLAMAVLAVAALASRGLADVTLPSLISDNMVIQRGMAAPIWGEASPGEKVIVRIGDQQRETKAGADGRWMVRLRPMEAGGPFELSVAGRNTIVVRNLLVGDVWLCSGQSNMEMEVWEAQNAQQEVAQASYPQIRVFDVSRTTASEPQRNVGGRWVVAGPDTAGDFSAVAYYFGRELHRTLGVPIGLLTPSWGGTEIRLWTDRASLASDPELRPLLETSEKRLADYADDLLTKQIPRLGEWSRSAAAAKAARRPLPLPPLIPMDPRHQPWRPELSGCLYNAMIAPLIPYGIKGTIWYQGESDAGQAYRYRKLFPALIHGWRRLWGQGDIPFLFVQLANFRGEQLAWAEPTESTWAELREAQLMALAVPKTGMAVTIDIGDPADIHPKNKQEVGRRLSLAARSIAYGEKLEYSGPIYHQMSVEGDKIRLDFSHAEGGLIVTGDKLHGFAIAGEDREFVWADAVAEGSAVVVSSPKVARPVAVRYGWDNSPSCNLYNREALPASPFRTDDWPGVTVGQ